MSDNASLLGFNGAPYDPVSGTYHLGNGYRTYSPVLKQFLSPDSMSPFGSGGINPYAYCAADPINHSDPSGHFHIGGFGIFGAAMAVLGVAATGAALFTGGASLGAYVAFAGAVTGATSAGTGIAADNTTGKAHGILAWVSLGTGIAGFALDAGGAGYSIAGKVGLVNTERDAAGVAEVVGGAGVSGRYARVGGEAVSSAHGTGEIVPVEYPKFYGPKRTAQAAGLEDLAGPSTSRKLSSGAGDEAQAAQAHAAPGSSGAPAIDREMSIINRKFADWAEHDRVRSPIPYSLPGLKNQLRVRAAFINDVWDDTSGLVYRTEVQNGARYEYWAPTDNVRSFVKHGRCEGTYFSKFIEKNGWEVVGKLTQRWDDGLQGFVVRKEYISDSRWKTPEHSFLYRRQL